MLANDRDGAIKINKGTKVDLRVITLLLFSRKQKRHDSLVYRLTHQC
jgi:cadmium resistance protein CadD (predicted permease)